VGKVGDDAFGCFLAGVLRREGVSTEGLVMTREAGTTLAFVHLLPGGDRAFTFYRKPGADMTLRASDLNLGLIRSARIFHFGSLSLTHPDPRKATLLAAMTAREAGAALSFDPNYREPLWGSLAEFRERSLAFLPMADVLKVSLEEALILGGDPGGMDAAARALLARGPSLVLVTLGAGGLAHYGPGGQKGLIPAPAVEAVDTTGAGDAFLGTFLGELSRREGLPLSLKEPGDHGASLARAVAAGTLACLRKGGISSIPSREDTLAMAARIRPGP
jgi:fructokinase